MPTQSPTAAAAAVHFSTGTIFRLPVTFSRSLTTNSLSEKSESFSGKALAEILSKQSTDEESSFSFSFSSFSNS